MREEQGIMARLSSAVWRVTTTTMVMVGLAAAAPVAAQKNQAAPVGPPAKSAAPVKELVSLLDTKKLTSYCVADPADATRFVALLHIPGTQLLVVSATYDHPTDIEYYIYQKDFMRAYQELNASILSKSKVFVEDLVEDGLKAMPAKNEAPDSMTVAGSRRAFDGDFADPKRRNQQNKITQDDYLKAYTEADETYSKLLATLIDGLKKAGT
jgi:hypothetical protein